MTYSTIIWDMDGTLLDTLQDLQSSVNHVLLQNHFPPRTLDEVRHFVGNGARRLMTLAVPGGESNPDFETYMAQFNAYYPLHCNDHTTVYPGLMPVLRQLRRSGIQMAVVSNKPDYGVKALARLHFDGLMAVAIGESAGVRRKPAPDTVLQAISFMGADPARCVYIGDSDVDIETAQNAGLPCISVTWGFRSRAFLLAHGASRCIDRPEELLQFFEVNYG